MSFELDLFAVLHDDPRKLRAEIDVGGGLFFTVCPKTGESWEETLTRFKERAEEAGEETVSVAPDEERDHWLGLVYGTRGMKDSRSGLVLRAGLRRAYGDDATRLGVAEGSWVDEYTDPLCLAGAAAWWKTDQAPVHKADAPPDVKAYFRWLLTRMWKNLHLALRTRLKRGVQDLSNFRGGDSAGPSHPVAEDPQPGAP